MLKKQKSTWVVLFAFWGLILFCVFAKAELPRTYGLREYEIRFKRTVNHDDFSRLREEIKGFAFDHGFEKEIKLSILIKGSSSANCVLLITRPENAFLIKQSLRSPELIWQGDFSQLSKNETEPFQPIIKVDLERRRGKIDTLARVMAPIITGQFLYPGKSGNIKIDAPRSKITFDQLKVLVAKETREFGYNKIQLPMTPFEQHQYSNLVNEFRALHTIVGLKEASTPQGFSKLLESNIQNNSMPEKKPSEVSLEAGLDAVKFIVTQVSELSDPKTYSYQNPVIYEMLANILYQIFSVRRLDLIPRDNLVLKNIYSKIFLTLIGAYAENINRLGPSGEKLVVYLTHTEGVVPQLRLASALVLEKAWRKGVLSNNKVLLPHHEIQELYAELPQIVRLDIPSAYPLATKKRLYAPLPFSNSDKTHFIEAQSLIQFIDGEIRTLGFDAHNWQLESFVKSPESIEQEVIERIKREVDLPSGVLSLAELHRLPSNPNQIFAKVVYVKADGKSLYQAWALDLDIPMATKLNKPTKNDFDLSSLNFVFVGNKLIGSTKVVDLSCWKKLKDL